MRETSVNQTLEVIVDGSIMELLQKVIILHRSLTQYRSLYRGFVHLLCQIGFEGVSDVPRYHASGSAVGLT